MPVATPDHYAQMLDGAKAKGFAFPAINVSSSSTINAVLQGLSEAESDGIIQVSTGGADFFAGQSVKARASGALAFAAYATEVAKNYPVTVALHTDHCPKDALDGFVLPLIAASEEAVKAGHAIKNVIKVGRRGICNDLVQHIRKRWNTSTVVKLRCSGKRANDMKVLASELEEQTGGTVLFRSGGTIILHAPGI